MNLRQALIEQSPSLALQRAAADEIAALDALIIKQREMLATAGQWRPIDTAPKDAFVLVKCPSGYRTTPVVATTAIMHSDYKQGRWVDHANDNLSDWLDAPTHWMPHP